MRPDRIPSSHCLWLTVLATLGISCRSPPRDSLDGGAARSSPPAPTSVAAPAKAEAGVSDWADEQMRNSIAAARAAAADAGSPAVARTFLGSFSEAEVRSAVGRPAAATFSFRIAEWPGHPDQLLALSFRPAAPGANSKSLEPRVTLLERRSGALVRVTEATIVRQKARCPHPDSPDFPPDDEGRAPDFKFDLGPYQIARESRAIGVRYSCSETWPAADADDEFLYLLEPIGKQLRQVLEVQIGFRHYDRPAFTDTSGIGTLSVLPEQAKAGYFDLLVRMSTTVENMSPEQPPGTHDPSGTTRKSSRETTQHFSWDGTRYRELAGAH